MENERHQHQKIEVSGRIDVHHHDAGVGGLSEVLKLLRDIKKSQEEFQMAVSADLKDLATKIDQATNEVAKRIDRISGQLTNNMTDSELSEVKASLQAEVDRLTVLGKDPANPVPTP